MRQVRAFAPAKINLCLHVTGQRADGYHLLDSLVAFAGIGDEISVEPAETLRLTIDGPMAQGLAAEGNLVLKAARFLNSAGTAAIRLTKNLPLASGIGGGSSDAAATLRALSALWGLALPEPEATAALGADVPACMIGQALRLRGIGEGLTRLPPLPEMDVLLVNPGVAVPTPAVFGALTRRDNPPLPETLPHWPDPQTFCLWLQDQRNDLLAPAITIAPVIARVLDTIRQTRCLFAGMSGSGATCFGLYPRDGHSADDAHQRVGRPGWWAATGPLS